MIRILLVSLAIAAAAQRALAIYEADLGPANYDTVVDGSKYTLLEFYAPWCGHCKSLAPEYEKLGNLFAASKDVAIVQVDADKHKDLAQKWEVKGFPTLKFLSKGKTDPSDAEDVNVARTADALLDFVNTRAGTAKKIKVEESKVVKLTDENFDGVVYDDSKHRLVEFYAPWCGHCKKLAPIYDKLAQLYEGEEDIVVSALDMDAHGDKGEPFGVTGFPTLKFFPKGVAREPESYESGRDLDSFVEFLNDKTGAELSATGDIAPRGGTVETLVGHVKSFMQAEDKAAVREAAAGEVSTLTERMAKNGAYYLKVMDNVVSKGSDFVQKELARLQKTLAQGGDSLKIAQKHSFQRRINVLEQFAGHEEL